MRAFELGDIIADREYVSELSSGTSIDVLVRLGRPVQDESGTSDAWYCPYQISGLGRDRVFAQFGVDALQALLLALHIIPVELSVFVREKGGRLHCFGGPDTTFLSGCRTAINCAADCFPSDDSS